MRWRCFLSALLQLPNDLAPDREDLIRYMIDRALT